MSSESKPLWLMQSEVVENCKNKGWYEDERSFGDMIALLHSEVSEMLEAYRDFGTGEAVLCKQPTSGEWKPCLTDSCTNPKKTEGIGSEAADVFIRLLDTCARYGIHLEEEYERKMAYNRTRPHRHGGRAL